MGEDTRQYHGVLNLVQIATFSNFAFSVYLYENLSHRDIEDLLAELWIKMVRSLMYPCRQSVMAQQLSASSIGYCAVMVVNPERS